MLKLFATFMVVFRVFNVDVSIFKDHTRGFEKYFYFSYVWKIKKELKKQKFETQNTIVMNRVESFRKTTSIVVEI